MKKTQQKFDKILKSVGTRIQDEVSGLIGATFTLSAPHSQLISKEDAFEQLSGKQVLAKMDVTGDVQGLGCLLLDLKDAIRLGGTLIMLPDDALEEMVSAGVYNEDAEDSYGEIANIIAGSYTKVFEEMYPQNCRFVRKTQEVIIPAKVDIGSDEPVPDQLYYQVVTGMNLNSRQMGNLVMLLPAASFGLEEDEPTVEAAPAVAPPKQEHDIAEKDAGNEPVESSVVSEPQIKKEAAPKFDVKKHRKTVDKILESVGKRIKDEVSGLIGATFTLSAPHSQLISKEDAFEQLSGKQVLAKMDVTGDVQGLGCLLLELKDAIRLGGTLIMLPDDALEEMVSAGVYNEDAEDSYGEIANIIAGSYTKVFEEMYPQNCRFVRKTQEVIIPAKVDIGSDEPVPDQLYYQVVTGMNLNSRQMGNLVMLLPAASFGLEEDEPTVEAAPPKQEHDIAEKDAGNEPVESSVVSEPQIVKESVPDFDVQKQRKRVDTLLGLCHQKMGGEVGALLGLEVVLSDQECRLVSKEDYFLDEALGKQILAHMDVVGEIEDKSYLFVSLKDAIYIGGTLIMLPPVELERAVLDEEFGEDTEDAYGEIANIMSGVYTSIFEEQYSKKIRFVKTGLEKVLPLKVETESETPLPNQFYYMSSSSLSIGGKALGKIQMLFPAAMLQLDGLVKKEEEQAAAPQGQESKATSFAGRAEGSTESMGGTFDVLVVSDDVQEAGRITDVLEQRQLSAKVLSFKESVTDYLPGEVKAVFLVMTNVNEKAFSVAIKISAACSLPLIAAGPGWTRSKVITAVKYGVDDILLTPASSDDIAEKIENISIKLAA